MKQFVVFYRVRPGPKGYFFESDPNLSAENLMDSHQPFVKVKASSIDKVFEACNLMWESASDFVLKSVCAFQESHGIKHTSMSVGDVVHDLDEDKYFQCAGVGWEEIPGLPSNKALNEYVAGEFVWEDAKYPLG